MQVNQRVFFDHVRGSLFDGSLSQSQVDGMKALLSEWEETGYSDSRWLAYCLATAFHETAFTMLPIKERGGRAYFMRMYDKTGNRPDVARELGNTHKGDGAKFAGRGYVQLTGRRNYGKASRALGIDFVREPDRVMEPDLAAHILYTGMAEGWFTGKGLASYINDTKCDYWNARRIVNGTDKARAIADYAIKFEAALEAAREAPQKPADTPKPIPEPTAPEKPEHWLVALLKAIAGIFKS